jgi:O-antigen/teichoic acid export membrane protein
MTATLAPPAAEAPRAMLRAVARGGLVNLVGAGFAGVAGFAVTWLVARGLSPVDAGGFFTATAAFGIGATIAKLGTPTALVYWPARLRASGAGGGAIRRCMRIGMVPVAITSFAVAAALWLVAGLLAPQVTAPLRAVAVALPAAALADAMLAGTRGYRTMRPTVVLDRIVRPGLQCLLLAALVVGGAAPWLLAAAWAAPFPVVTLLSGYALSRLLGRARDTSGAPERREFWAFTGPRAAASVAHVALQRLDIVLVAAFGGLAAAALYTVAGRFVVLGQFVSGAVAHSAQPRLAERLSTSDHAGAGALYRQTTAWLILANWPMYLLVAGYAPLYLGLFGPQYRDGVGVVVVLAVAMLVATGCGTVDMVLAMGGRTWWNLANVLVALATLLAVGLTLVPSYGALGAAYALASAVIVNNVVPLVQVWRTLKIHPFGRATLAAAGLALVCFGVPAVLALTTPGALAIVAGVAGAVVYLFGALRLRILLGGR